MFKIRCLKEQFWYLQKQKENKWENKVCAKVKEAEEHEELY